MKKTKEQLAKEYSNSVIDKIRKDRKEDPSHNIGYGDISEIAYKIGFDAGAKQGRQDALRKSVEICETYEKRSNYTWANGGYSEHDFINEGMIRMAKLLNSEIQSLMQQFNNEGEMKWQCGRCGKVFLFKNRAYNCCDFGIFRAIWSCGGIWYAFKEWIKK